jgi:hypothetical protein
MKYEVTLEVVQRITVVMDGDEVHQAIDNAKDFVEENIERDTFETQGVYPDYQSEITRITGIYATEAENEAQ